jgi:hypothetical protein
LLSTRQTPTSSSRNCANALHSRKGPRLTRVAAPFYVLRVLVYSPLLTM